jgi:hypothetical protein
VVTPGTVPRASLLLASLTCMNVSIWIFTYQGPAPREQYLGQLFVRWVALCLHKVIEVKSRLQSSAAILKPRFQNDQLQCRHPP